MPASILSKAAHTPVGSRGAAEPAKRFFSTEPSFGASRKRHPVNAAGFEALPGFTLPTARPAAPPRLRAISELTYGLPAAALVPGIGPTQAVVPDTTLYPWCANAALRITVPGKSEVFIGTGWFAGPYAVITAAHAVYPRESGGYVGWASQIEVIPGQNGDGNKPNGSSVSSLFYCPNDWQSEGDDRLDYGVVLLPDGLGSQVGTYGYSTYADADLRSAIANLAGYPVAPPDAAQPPGRQWYGANNVSQVDDSFVYYDLSTVAGESGSAVYRNIGSNSYVMAIHTSASSNQNRGVRIIDPVYGNIQQWAGMHG
jgi:V8-like Glu-specific endopeptidase